MRTEVKVAKKISLDAALLASFSALYMVILKMLPGIPAFGISGAKIEIAIALSPIYGLLLGHVLAPSSIFLGTLMAMLIFPGKYTLFSYVTMFAAPLGALTSSLIFDQRKAFKLPKWIYSIVIYAALLLTWFATDVGSLAALFTIPYFAVMGFAAFSGIASSMRKTLRAAPLRILAGCAGGIFADHLYGSLGAIIVFRYLTGAFVPEALAAIYLAAIPIVLIERGLMIAFSFIVALNLYLALRKSRYFKVRVVEGE
ncbi:MAG: hypothetical protein N3F65_04185 [Nitrososphaeria archaeon]|nr:hypothetical protein [Nitrososphaeria archaeon]